MSFDVTVPHCWYCAVIWSSVCSWLAKPCTLLSVVVKLCAFPASSIPEFISDWMRTMSPTASFQAIFGSVAVFCSMFEYCWTCS